MKRTEEYFSYPQSLFPYDPSTAQESPSGSAVQPLVASSSPEHTHMSLAQLGTYFPFEVTNYSTTSIRPLHNRRTRRAGSREAFSFHGLCLTLTPAWQVSSSAGRSVRVSGRLLMIRDILALVELSGDRSVPPWYHRQISKARVAFAPRPRKRFG